MDRVVYFIWLSCRFCERMFRVVCGVRGVRCVVCGTKLQSQLGPDGGSGATGDVLLYKVKGMLRESANTRL